MSAQTDTGQDPSYFRLADTCRLVEGKTRSLIYDITTGDSYHLQPALSRLIGGLQEGVPLQEAVERVPCSVDQGRKALEALMAPEVGTFCSQATAGNPSSTADRSPPAKTLYAEITAECSLNCSFCQPGSAVINRLDGCHRWARNPEIPELELDEWQQVIDDVRAAGYTELVLVGGDPLRRWELTLGLIDYAQAHGIEQVVLETHGLELTQERMGRLHEREVSLLLPFFSLDPELFDRMAGVPGAFDRVFQHLEYLLLIEAAFYIRVPVCDENRDGVEEMTQTLLSLGVDWVFRSPIFGRNGSSLKAWCQDEEVTGIFFDEDFFERQQRDLCWAHQCYVTSTGDVVPCLHARRLMAGNVRDGQSASLVEPLEQLKHHVTIKLEPCHQCEFRVGCPNCLMLAYEHGGSLQTKDPRCTYDPVAGQWAETAIVPTRTTIPMARSV